MHLQPDKYCILNHLRALARSAGRPPSRSEFHSLAGIPEHQVSRFFPTWNDALRAAGLAPYTLNLRLEDRALLENWASLVRANRAIPSRRLYRLRGKYDTRTTERRFGPWSTLPQVFRDFARRHPRWARPWTDVLALLPVPGPRPVPKPVPSPAPHSTAAPAPAPLRFLPSSKNAAPNRQARSSRSPAKIHHSPLQDRPVYGPSLDFRGLRHEPVNEQGVVLLFGMVAKELGYIVESVQSGFPDCEAKRQIGSDRWQRVRLEFEFESRNFRDHGHPPAGCDVIVCWRHNWPACPPHLEILELSSLLPSLPAAESV